MTRWGSEEFVRLVNPSLDDDAELARYWGMTMRSSVTPRNAAAQYNSIVRNDVRQALPLIQAPTLVLHVGQNPLLPIANGRYLAEHIDGATFVELPGGDLGPTPATTRSRTRSPSS